MFSNRPFHKFESDDELTTYMQRYKLIPLTKNSIPVLYFSNHNIRKRCKLIGYEENYDTWSTAVIDYGEGPFFIHVDFLRDMQASPERDKGDRLNILPSSYVIFDLETTSLNVREAEVISISAAKVIDGVIMDTFSTLVKPQNPIPSRITKLTGITNLDVCFAPEIESALKDFLDYIGDAVLAGYNIHSYDTNIIYDYVKSLYGREFCNDYFDFLYYFKDNIPSTEIKNYKLVTVAEYLGVDNSNAHHSLDDCTMCFECYNALNQEVDSAPVVSLSDVNCINSALDCAIVEKLQELILTKKLPANSLYLYSNRARKGSNADQVISKTICIWEPEYPVNKNTPEAIGQNFRILKVTAKANGQIVLTVRKTQFDELTDSFTVTANKKGGKEEKGKFYDVTFSSSDDPQILSYIMANVEYCLKHYRSSSSFGCCSQFIRCSDERQCLHENKLYSTGCYYRHNLEAGRIFYGKNRNID